MNKHDQILWRARQEKALGELIIGKDISETEAKAESIAKGLNYEMVTYWAEAEYAKQASADHGFN